jgi:murein tripeptide amidase MpaA
MSNFVLKGFIKFLLQNSPESKLLLKNFVFRIIPMLNPDGVRHGFYRYNLTGADLNRR